MVDLGGCARPGVGDRAGAWATSSSTTCAFAWQARQLREEPATARLTLADRVTPTETDAPTLPLRLFLDFLGVCLAGAAPAQPGDSRWLASDAVRQLNHLRGFSGSTRPFDR